MVLHLIVGEMEYEKVYFPAQKYHWFISGAIPALHVDCLIVGEMEYEKVYFPAQKYHWFIPSTIPA